MLSHLSHDLHNIQLWDAPHPRYFILIKIKWEQTTEWGNDFSVNVLHYEILLIFHLLDVAFLRLSSHQLWVLTDLLLIHQSHKLLHVPIGIKKEMKMLLKLWTTILHNLHIFTILTCILIILGKGCLVLAPPVNIFAMSRIYWFIYWTWDINHLLSLFPILASSSSRL